MGYAELIERSVPWKLGKFFEPILGGLLFWITKNISVLPFTCFIITALKE